LSKNKTATLIAFFLMFAMAVSLVALPAADAHDPPWTVPSFTLLSAGPNPIGVGQPINLAFWARPAIPTAGGGNIGDRYKYMIEVTKPNGETDTLGPITSDAGGDAFTRYIPDQAGTYSFVAKFQEITLTGIPGNENNPAVGDTVLASESTPENVTVQDEPIPVWQEAPLPTEFWTRPINQLNRAWYTIAANWLGKESAAHDIGWGINTDALNLRRLTSNSLGPESAHIMWTRPLWAGGIADALLGDKSFQSVHYEGLKLLPPIILDGKLIYSNYDTFGSVAGWWVVDLYTGKTIEFFNTTRTASITGHGPWNMQPTFASIYLFESPNEHGAFPLVWITRDVTLPEGYVSAPRTQTWEVLDGYTFSPVCIIANVTATLSDPATGILSTQYPAYGNDGSILIYSLATANDVQYLRCWNASQVEGMGYIAPGQTGDFRPDQGSFVKDGDTGWSLNVSISPAVSGNIFAVRQDKYVIGGTGGKNNGTDIIKGNLWALSLEPGREGTLLWSIDFTPPETVVPDIVIEFTPGFTGFKHRKPVGLDGVDPEDGVFTFSEGVTRRRWGYSLDTGKMLWGPTDPEPAFNFFDSMPNVFYQGMLISWGYGGVVTAYNVTTGEVLWKYTAKSVGYESPYGNDPLNLEFVADGKLYFDSSDHSPNSPLSRGYYLRCVNASNGAELWKLSNWGTASEAIGTGGTETAVIADGYIVAFNAYDAQIYCIGKGPSDTSVSASPKISVLGDGVLVEGSVIDTAAGTMQTEQAGRFPDGVPAMSDESMDLWMEYVYEQQPRPANATGVEVTISVLDPNNNFYDVGTATSDASGNYKVMFTPEVPGEYTIIATFAGSASYYGSSAETHIGVTEAPTATPEPTPIPASLADIYFLPMSIGIIIAIVVVGLLLFLLLRKR
jgi:outer membrane protein assembly factor BamB